MADDLSSLYLSEGTKKITREVDAWLLENSRPPSAQLAPRQQYEALVDELAPQYGQDPTMVKAMIQAESGWNPNARSPKGAEGIVQLMPTTARRFGVTNAYDPAQAIPGMLRYLKTLSDEFGDPVKVVAAYNAGEGAVRQYGGVPPYEETLGYVRKVFGGAEGAPYASRGQGVGPRTSPRETQDLRTQAQAALSGPPPEAPRSESAQILDTTVPSLTPEMLDQAKLLAYQSPGAGMGPQTFPPERRLGEEPSLEEPLWQRVPLRIMEGVFGTMAGVAGLPMTAGRLLGLSEQEATQLFPTSAGLKTGLQTIARSFDPVGQESNVIDRFAQTLGQQVVFFGSGAAVAGGARAIAQFAPSIGRALGATTAAVQEAGMEAQETLDALTPIVGEREAASRANTVFWKNAAVLAVTNKLGVFSEAAMPNLMKIVTAASMEGFQEVAQYDIERRQMWVPASHPLGRQLQALGWKRHANRVYQPFDMGDAAEVGIIGGVIGGMAGHVTNQQGQQVLPRETEARMRRGLENIGASMGQLLSSERGGISLGRGGQREQNALYESIRQRVAGMEDSQVRDAEGRLIRMYHGTSQVFGQFAQGEVNPSALYGPGFYFTDNPEVAGGRPEDMSREGARLGYASGATGGILPRMESQPVATFSTYEEATAYARELGVSQPEATPIRTRKVVDGQYSVYRSIPIAPNVRPVYLDIKHPFDIEAHYSADEVERIAQYRTQEGMDGQALYERLTTDFQTKENANDILRQAGYDGIVHTGGTIRGGEPHQVYIAFTPEQVIPAFELEAHPWFKLALAYSNRALQEPTGEQALVEGVGTGGILGSETGALNPFKRFNLFPQRPSPPPPKYVPTIAGGATGLERGNFRDAQGRWRLPLAQMPSIELELQDLVRQQGGIRLEGEELRGELSRVITRKETGRGGLQNAAGMSLQQMAEKADELGFIASADKSSLLEALDRSVTQGHEVYSRYATGIVPLVHSPELSVLYRDVAEMATLLEANVEVQRRGTRPRAPVHEEARQFVESGGWTIDDVRELLPGQVLDDTTASALVQLLGRVAADAGTIAEGYIRQVEQGGTQPGAGSLAEQDWLAAFAGVGSTHPQRLGVMAEAGRTLGILNDPLSSTNRMLNDVGGLIAKSPGMDSYKLAKKYLSLLQEAGGKEAVKFGQKAIAPTYGSMLLELYYQGMLSNPRTWLTNEVSNLTTAAWALPVRMASAVYSQTLGSGEISLMEPAAYAYGLMHQVQKAWQMSALAWKTGAPQFGRDIPGIMEPIGQQKGGIGSALTTQNLQALGWNIDPQSPTAKLMDFWFEYIGLLSGGRIGTNVMQNRDEFYKAWNYFGELGALAYRKAVLEGSIDPQASFTDTMTQALHDPLPEDMHQAAAQHALVQTFQNELMAGGLASRVAGFQQWAPDIPGFGPFPVGRLVVPFLHVAANIPRYALENSPLAFFFKSVRDDIAAGGARGDLATGKILMGSVTATTFAVMASSGLITGRGPEDKDLRAALVRVGWQPYSVYVPWLGLQGGYVSLRALDPIVGQHAGIMADIVEIFGEQGTEWYEKAALGPLFAIASNLGSRSYMRGMSTFFDIFSPRSMRTLEGESAMEGLRGFARGELSVLAPAVWSVAEKAIDPATKAAWGITEGLRGKVPGWAEGLPNYRNKWGDKRLLGWGWSPEWLNWVEGFTEAVNPLKVSTLVSDPLDRVLLRDQIRLGMPVRTLGIRGPQDVTGHGAEDAYLEAGAADPYAVKPIGLKPDQYEKYVALTANNAEAIRELGLQVNDKAERTLRLQVGGHTGTMLPAHVPSDLYSVMLWATTTKQYQDATAGPDGGREQILRRIDHAYRQFGRDQLLANDDELRQRYVTAEALHQLQRTPVPQQERMRGQQQRFLQHEEQRLQVGAPR